MNNLLIVLFHLLSKEPQKSYHKHLAKNRKNVCFDAISDTNDIVMFTEIKNRKMCSGITKKRGLFSKFTK